MTITSVPVNDRVERFTASGGQTVFSFDFPVYAATDIEVRRLRGTAESLLVYGADYTVSGAGDQAGGTITLTTGALAGDVVVLRSAQPVARTTDFQDGGDLPADSLDAELNRIFIVKQQQAATLDRSLRAPWSDPPLNTLPTRAARAGRYAKFNADGDLVGAEPTDSPTPVTIAQIDVTDPAYGAVGNGVADDTAAIKAAIAYAESLAGASFGGAEVWFPGGNYKCTDTLNITKSFVTLRGPSAQGTTLTFSSMTNKDWIVFGVAGGSTIRRGGMTSIGIVGGSGNTSTELADGTVNGASVKVVNTFDMLFDRVTVELSLCPFDVGPGTNITRLQNCYLRPDVSGARYGINWHAPGDGSARSDNLWLAGTVVDGGFVATSTIGLNWRGFCHTLYAQGGAILKCDRLLHAQNPAASIQYYPTFGTFVMMAFEGAKTRAIELAAANDVDFAFCPISNSTGASGQGGADDNAVRILPDASGAVTRSVSMTDCRIGECRQEGLRVECRDFQLTNSVILSTSQAGSAVASAIQIRAGTVGAHIVNVVAEEFGGAALAAYGVSIQAGAQAVTIMMLDARAAVTGAINDATSGSVMAAYVWGPGGAQTGWWASPVGRYAEARHSHAAGTVDVRATNTATGASAQARLTASTGTANAFLAMLLQDNSGSPIGFINGGSALTRLNIDAAIIALRTAAGAEMLKVGQLPTAYADNAAASAGGVPVGGVYRRTADNVLVYRT